MQRHTTPAGGTGCVRSRYKGRRFFGFYGTFVRALFRPLQRCILKPLTVLSLALAVSSFCVQAAAAKDGVAPLTKEEREILKDRELLDNLVLLQNLDTIEFIDILNAMQPDWSLDRDKQGVTTPNLPEKTSEEGNKP